MLSEVKLTCSEFERTYIGLTSETGCVLVLSSPITALGRNFYHNRGIGSHFYPESSCKEETSQLAHERVLQRTCWISGTNLIETAGGSLTSVFRSTSASFWDSSFTFEYFSLPLGSSFFLKLSPLSCWNYSITPLAFLKKKAEPYGDLHFTKASLLLGELFRSRCNVGLCWKKVGGSGSLRCIFLDPLLVKQSEVIRSVLLLVDYSVLLWLSLHFKKLRGCFTPIFHSRKIVKHSLTLSLPTCISCKKNGTEQKKTNKDLRKKLSFGGFC